MSEEEIIDAMKKLEEVPIVKPGKIYLTSGQASYKKYFEIEGFEVVITDTLPEGIDIIYGNFE